MAFLARIRYYTGTGNTARAVGLLAEALGAAGWSVDASEVNFGGPVPAPGDLGPEDLLVLACPTLGFSAPVHFLRWARRLGRFPGTKAAILTTCVGHCGILVPRLALLLRRRGFHIVSASAHAYPDNWTQVTNPPSPEASQRIFSAADPGVAEAGAALAAGRGRYARLSPAVMALTAVVAVLFGLVGRRAFGKLYVSDETCTACGLCVRMCPSRTIKLREGRPAWGLDCDGCNRCINLCPTRSIQVSAVRALVHVGGNLALTGAALVLAGPWGWPAALGLLVGGTIVQVTIVDAVLGSLEGFPAARRILAWGWTAKFRRYRAPGFRPFV